MPMYWLLEQNPKHEMMRTILARVPQIEPAGRAQDDVAEYRRFYQDQLRRIVPEIKLWGLERY